MRLSRSFVRLLASRRSAGPLALNPHACRLDDPLTWGILPAHTYLNSHMTRWSLGASDIIFTNPYGGATYALSSHAHPSLQRLFRILQKRSGTRDVPRRWDIPARGRHRDREAARRRVGASSLPHHPTSPLICIPKFIGTRLRGGQSVPASHLRGGPTNGTRAPAALQVGHVRLFSP